MKTAIVIGAGPAGLTAALELIRQTDIRPIVLEKSDAIGGLSRTVNYKGNRIDIGGHRFFSKSDRVMQWWMEVLPLEASRNGTEAITYHGSTRSIETSAAGPAPAEAPVMLIRQRKSRIYFLRRFFEYPLRLSADTFRKLGAVRTARIGLSYIQSRIRPVRKEKTLEDFLINRFGRELYRMFFKSYTEKVWGVPCDHISSEWGAQRIKGLDASKLVKNALRRIVSRKGGGDLGQKQTETSLIEKFLYPKLGPGQLWETVAESICQGGGSILHGWQVDRLLFEGGKLTGVAAVHSSGERRVFAGDYFFSTMPVQELVRAIETDVPANVRQVSEGLVYRDFITVGLLVNRLTVRDNTANGNGAGLLKDNWIYIQEPDVLAGRMQIFNNWSPWMVSDPAKVWIGIEYFCNEGDALWRMRDDEIRALAGEELERIGILRKADVLDGTVIRVEKTYPAYFGTYDRFEEIREYLDGFDNLFLIGRNGMHKYNNQDHSMLTAITAVENIAAGRTDKSNIWQVNTEMEYHESK